MRHRAVLIALLGCRLACAQHWVNPNFPCHRLDLRDLGYPEVNEIPANSSAITSLLASRNGKVYGATTGDQAYLFVYEPAVNKVRHLGRIQGQESVHHSLVEDRDGRLYIGTGRNVFRPVSLTRDLPPGRDSVSETLWRDVKKPYQDYPGGHLYRYDHGSESQVLMPGEACPVEDLGIPVPGNGVYALAVDPSRHAIYGISYPDGHLFEYDIGSKRFRDLGELDRRAVFHGPERDWRSVARALIVDGSGKVWTSGEDGFLVGYQPGEAQVRPTGLRIPGEYYPVQAYVGHPVVEYFTAGPKGLIYGASSDGFLFSFDPVVARLVNLGKPRVSRRLRALAMGRNGRLYMIAGERIEPCRLFSFDPEAGGFEDLGILAVDRSPHYSWRGYQFDSMVTGPDGTIYAGESERRSHLFLFLPP